MYENVYLYKVFHYHGWDHILRSRSSSAIYLSKAVRCDHTDYVVQCDTDALNIRHERSRYSNVSSTRSGTHNRRNRLNMRSRGVGI
jgi:hypothetical protein